MTEKDFTKLKDVLNLFERQTLHETGVGLSSGGFAKAEMWSDIDDDEAFDIELRWGIQSDCQNVVHVEGYKLLREYFDSTDEVEKLVDLIES